jgi:hypothetical protein
MAKTLSTRALEKKDFILKNVMLGVEPHQHKNRCNTSAQRLHYKVSCKEYDQYVLFHYPYTHDIFEIYWSMLYLQQFRNNEQC